MKIIADLHIHSKYSRGCSKDLDLKNLEKWARIKGINLLGTGDFTHPIWIEELKKNLKEDGSGILKTESGFPFVLQTEISLIYSQGGKGRRVHVIILSPSFKIVDEITDYFKRHGRVDYDGRPIFKISAENLVKDLLDISKDIEVIPAHIWTPWFSLFGSNSGFDTIKEAFGKQAKNIHALETGLSSDPKMNWRLSQLDNYSLVSFSDIHSFWPWRLGREVTIFDINMNYVALLKALRTGKGLDSTIEVDPNYGKYHFDGHRNCNISFSPKETRKNKGICPVCKKQLTIGVQYRVEELADREEEYSLKTGKPFRHLLPLSDIISAYVNSAVSSKKVWEIYNKLIEMFGNEFNVLLNAKKEELTKVVDEKLADYIIKNRNGNVEVIPGYDGEYGIPIFDDKDKKNKVKKTASLKKQPQKDISDFI